MTVFTDNLPDVVEVRYIRFTQAFGSLSTISKVLSKTITMCDVTKLTFFHKGTRLYDRSLTSESDSRWRSTRVSMLSSTEAPKTVHNKIPETKF